MKKLAISIVTYNAEHDIEKCLESLRGQSFKDFRLIIVDNASVDNTIEKAKSIFPQAEYHLSPKNLGFGAGHNIAIAQAGSKWVLILNQDAVLDEKCLENLMKKTSLDDIGAIGPLLYRDESKVIDTAGLARTFYYKIFDQLAGIKKGVASDYVWGISGACAMYKISALNEIAYKRSDRDYPEYFDENFFMYKEDVDLAARLNRKAYRSWLESSAIGYHPRTGRAPESLTDVKDHREKIADYVNVNSYRNHWYFLIKNVKAINILPALLYEFIKFTYLLLFERKTLQGIKEIPKNLKTMFKRRYV